MNCQRNKQHSNQTIKRWLSFQASLLGFQKIFFYICLDFEEFRLYSESASIIGRTTKTTSNPKKGRPPKTKNDDGRHRTNVVFKLFPGRNATPRFRMHFGFQGFGLRPDEMAIY
jgi:hypothetical protein